MKFDKSQIKKLYDFYLEISKILFDKLKPGGYFLSFSSPRLYHSIAMACEIAGFEIRDMINWVYTQTMPKGMSITHIIKKNKDLSEEEKGKLIEEYNSFITDDELMSFMNNNKKIDIKDKENTVEARALLFRLINTSISKVERAKNLMNLWELGSKKNIIKVKS